MAIGYEFAAHLGLLAEYFLLGGRMDLLDHGIK